MTSSLDLDLTRRHLFSRTSRGIGAIALASLLDDGVLVGAAEATTNPAQHFQPKATRVIYLFQSGGPSQLDLFDPKPDLHQRFGEEVPLSVYPAERKTTMTSAQKSFATAPSRFQFHRAGESGAQISETLPNIAKIADEICIVKSMYSEAINHDPAITFFQTGSQIPGRPSIGSWVNYGLGTAIRNLPGAVAYAIIALKFTRSRKLEICPWRTIKILDQISRMARRSQLLPH